MGEFDEQLQELLPLRGRVLIDALIKHISDLNLRTSQLERELAALRDYQAATQRWLQLASSNTVELPQAVDIEATELLPANSGFYPIEYSSSGTGFRWTGPESRFWFNAFINRARGASLELHALRFVDAERQRATIRLMVDGQSVPVDIQNDGKGLIVAAQLSPRQENHASRLEFFVETMSPTNSSDKRLLGLSFSKLQIKAAEPHADSQPDSAAVKLRIVTSTQTKKAE